MIEKKNVCFYLFYPENNIFTGPVVWGGISENCDGRFQSPVNIITRKMLTDGRLTPFQLVGYQETFHGHLINNGHTGAS